MKPIQIFHQANALCGRGLALKVRGLMSRWLLLAMFIFGYGNSIHLQLHADVDHWAFKPISTPSAPPVANPNWPRQTLDDYILSAIEGLDQQPPYSVSPRNWIRRVYLSTIGIPPSPEATDQFVANPSDDQRQAIVDQLLSSPHYGEKWGRHWLDVARYGDSNGGDENHAYPLAYRYRNWVIESFNRDLPFDQFVHQQLAGDLLIDDLHSAEEKAALLTATGFLAIGTKILAEQDPIKKRADIVDEQIDTVTKSLIGLTVACARCHDHKFDPIPTADYYAMAGIFHSTSHEDRPIETAAYNAETRKYAKEKRKLTQELARRKKELEAAEISEFRLTRQAESFDRGNVVIDKDSYGQGIGIISDPGGQKNFAEYELFIEQAGTYKFDLRYAAEKARPGRLFINGEPKEQPILASTTGGWFPNHQRWHTEGLFDLSKGTVLLRIESEPLMSHVDQLRLTPIKDVPLMTKLIEEMRLIESELKTLEENAPEPQMVMAAAEGEVADTKLHRRGDHNNLGRPIPRGALSTIGPEMPPLQDQERSGRLEFANWITHVQHPLAARVIVNRLWRWHFGKGIVPSMDNFGLNGAKPTFPKLLDHLANELIQSGWSLKHLHRQILLSSTFAIDRTALSHQKHPIWTKDRLEAEIIRDSVLAVSGQLENTAYAAPISIKTQDPSPMDLANNLKTYESSRKRSVYLPIVRCNVFDFFSLFDYPDPSSTTGSRATTTTPTQALLMMNSQFLETSSQALVDSLSVQHGSSAGEAFIAQLYRRLFQRKPSEQELASCQAFLKNFETTIDANSRSIAAKEALCHTLLLTDEFVSMP